MFDLSRDDIYLSLPDQARAELLGDLRSKSFQAGQLIFQQGDIAQAYYYLQSGEVDVNTLTSDGVEMRIARLSSPYWFGEMSFLDKAPRTHTVTAAIKSEIAILPAQKISILIDKYPEFHKALVLKLCQHTRMLYAAVNDFLLLPPERLLAKRLIESLKSNEEDLHISLTQDDMARLIGVSRQSISRILRSWEVKNYVLRKYRSVEVVNINWPALSKWSNRFVSLGGFNAGRHAAALLTLSGMFAPFKLFLGHMVSGAGGRYPNDECGRSVL